MDLIKEIRDLKEAIRDALEDGRITFREAIRLAKEAADILEIILPLIIGKTSASQNSTEDQTSADS